MNVRWLNNIFSINAILLLMLFFTACEEKPAALPGDYSDMPLYADFRISGDEEGGKITVLLQFRAGAVDGPGVALEAPAAIYFDGQELHMDSSRMHGVFYEQNWLLQDFDSSHLLEYINKEGDTLKKNIHFPRFQLNTIIPPKWSGDSMALEISGLPDNAVLQVMLLDTSYISKGINKDIYLKNNMIYLGKEEFAALKKGPVFLDLLYVDQSSIPEDSEDGGQLFMSYGLRRSFVLE